MTTVRSQKSLASFLLWRSSRPEDVVALADGGQRPRRVVRVGAEEQVDAGAPYLFPLAELVELGARRDQHLAGPAADLGEEDAGGLAVGEEDADGLAVHSRLPALMTRLNAYVQAVGLGHNVLFARVTTPGALPLRRHAPLVVFEAGSCEADLALLLWAQWPAEPSSLDALTLLAIA